MYNGPHRKPLRLKNHNYSNNGYYFLTICTKARECFFGEIVDGKMVLNEYGRITKKYWQEIPKHYQNVIIDEFIIMPNHIHGILIVGNEYFRSDNFINLENNNNFDENNLNNNNVDEQNINEKDRNENIRSLRGGNLSNVVKGFKIGCTKHIRNNNNDYIFGWHKSFYDVIIKNDEQLEKSRKYIINNPLKWEMDINNIP